MPCPRRDLSPHGDGNQGSALNAAVPPVERSPMAVITRRSAGFSIRRAHVLAVAVFAVALAALAAAHDHTDDSRLTPPQAERAALDSPQVRNALAGGFTRVQTMPLDGSTVRVSFFDGPR